MGRLSYFTAFKKTASTTGGKLMHRTNVLLDPSTPEGAASVKALEAAIKKVKAETWPGKDPKFPDPKRFPLLDGNDYTTEDGEVRDGYADVKYIGLRSERKPKFRDRDGQTEVTDEDGILYSGCYAIVYGHLYGVKGADKGGNGIFATLDAVQFYKKGEPFGGGGIADDEFATDLGDEEEDDETPTPKKTSSKPAAKKRTIDDDDEI
jgi:hypothetical protein